MMQPVRPGPRNLITDIAGISVGHAVNETIRTGVSVVVAEAPAVTGVSVPGGGPGTRETDALQADTLVDRADAIVLSGGSVYGLDAASGVTAAMGSAGRGFPTGAALPSPIIPAAILFDMTNGGDKQWGDTPPYNALGRAAYGAHQADFALGNIGVGYGAQAGQLKGGLGSASTMLGDEVKVGALIGANPLGSPVDAKGRFWAQGLALLEKGKGPEQGSEQDPKQGHVEFGRKALLGQLADATTHPMTGAKMATALGNTTIGVVAVAADLTVAEATRVAIMAQDGLARAIRPVHTPFDGDCLFVMATGQRKLAEDEALRPAALAELGALAADCVARATARGVWHAETLGDIESYHTRFGG